MAYYYYYQQNNTSTESSLSPDTTAAQLTPPPLLLLSPSPKQNLTLPLLTPSVTMSSMSITTTAVVTTDHHQQQQLPTPNTFIKHCEDMGLFKDLQNVLIASGQPDDTTVTTPAAVTSTATVVTASVPTVESNISNLFSSSSSAVVKHMMANPFDETFKQAVLQQQKANANPTRDILNNNNYDSDGELNTPFIIPVTVEDMYINNNNNSSTESTSVDIRATAVMDTTLTAESMTTVQSQSEQQNTFITTSTAEAKTTRSLPMLKEQQHCNLIQQQDEQNNHVVEQQLVIPLTTTIPSVVDLTIMAHCDKNGDNTAVNVENGTTIIKQALKRNLLVKQMMHKRHKQQDNNIGIVDETVVNKINNSNGRENDDNENQLQKQLQKQDLLERNRSAAKRCRIKRKQRWELLSEENRKLKLENFRLREAFGKFVSEHLRWTSQQQQQAKTALNTFVKGKDDQSNN